MPEFTTPPTVAALADRLIDYADRNDAFGATQEGNDMRLAASVILEFEKMMNNGLAQLQAQIDGLK